jgi:hypothetical protein
LADDFNAMVARLKGEVVDPPTAETPAATEEPTAVAAN